MNRPHKSSIKRKVMRVIMLASVTVLLVTVAAFMTYDLVTFRRTLVRNLATLARTLAENSTAALEFQNQSDAANVLASLRTEPHLTAAALYDAQGRLFVKYPAFISNTGLPAAPHNGGYQFGTSYLVLYQPVIRSGTRVGTLYLQSDLTALNQRIQLYGAISLFIMAGSLLVAWWLSITLQRRIANPIVALAKTARHITGQQDFSLRARKSSDDELGDLTDAFNSMLDQIQASNSALRESQAHLSAIFNQAGAGIAQCDLAGRFLMVNDRYCEITGHSRAELLKMSMQDITCPEDLAESVSALKNVKQGSPTPVFEKRYVRSSGDLVWARVSVVLLRDAQGNSRSTLAVAQDISEEKRAEKALRQVAAIVESSDDAIVSKDLNGIISSWNRGAERLFGYQAAEIIGRPITILIPPNRAGEDTEILKRIRRGEGMEHYETVRQRKDGKLIEISLTVSPIKDAGGAIIGVSKIARDISDQKQAERELEHAHKEAVAASRAKDDFLAALSHELRTPLNPVLLLASEAAEDPQLPAPVRAQFATIRNNIELEARLIDDLLDLTRITRGKLSLNQQPLNVHQVVQAAVNIVRAEAETKKITLALEFCGGEQLVFGDSVRLQQVFWNVLKNAVKFTPPAGKITVKTFAQGNEFFIQVTDTGIGINPDELQRVFTAFAQGDHAEGGSHRFGGLGLGLAISQKLVELHSGLIQAASDGRDKGATFTIQLPLCAAASQMNDAKGPAPLESSQLPARGQRILLVEDHEPTRTALAHLLTRRHFTVLTAASLVEARAVAGKNKIDLLISDIGLPDGNGYDLMSEMKKAFGLKGIALTGYGMEDDVLQSKQAGFVAHLTKPVRIQSLDTVLAAALTA